MGGSHVGVGRRYSKGRRLSEIPDSLYRNFSVRKKQSYSLSCVNEENINEEFLLRKKLIHSVDNCSIGIRRHV